ncbi:MAG: patatin-like phospholipase family protein [Paludibacter sp.]
MKKIVLIFYLSISLLSLLSAQKVGLVLSGGGAKGIAHIGVLKALEENHIPVDYIAGTSMGAIVGSMYAMGYTPDEIIEIFKSNDFKHWSTGEIESDYIYYYRNGDHKPDFIGLKFKIDKQDTLDIRSKIIPTYLVSPRQMNYAFVPLFAQANAVAGGNFDSLFIPFRCVASDIYRKEAVVFRSGVLGDVIRASMTFPFRFKPIRIDNNLLFDGGIYNNFPVNVMRDDFKPDFIIGSVVANNPEKPDELDIMTQIENMIMKNTNYDILKTEGVLLRFDLKNRSTFDFSRINELVKMGYDSAIHNMAEIKLRIPRSVSQTDLTQKRKTFRSRFPALKFQHVIVKGVDSLQQKYVERTFHYDNYAFDLKDFKQAYFKLISDDKISEVIPHAIYNPTTGLFDLMLNVQTEDHLKLLFGGNISLSNSNQAYLGLSYQNLTQYAQTAYLDAHFGRFYNALRLATRIDFPNKLNWYLKLTLTLHKFNYFDGNSLLFENDRTTNFKQYETFGKMCVGFPFTMKGRLEVGFGYGWLTDYYPQNNLLASTSGETDKSTFLMAMAYGRIESYTLNHTMYATKGYNYSSSIHLFGGTENFKSADNSIQNPIQKTDVWLQYRAKIDRYFPVLPQFSVGVFGELVYSTRNLLQNYTATVIQASNFHPTPHSKTVFNEAFSANQFAAIGIKPIFNFSKELYIRQELYGFVPYKTILRMTDNAPIYSKPFNSSQFISETSLVFNFKVASAAMFLNYYSSPARNWNFGVNIGFLLFNAKFME